MVMLDCWLSVEKIHPDNKIHFELEVPDELDDEQEIEDRVHRAAEELLRDELNVHWLLQPPGEHDYN